ncbi:MAG TPA: sugar transferase [Candidatus Acidoferrales bacterium]|jgi:lipopolysaccharide/colanic/teichoic acid biosynthesis glycosyltransferase|nr:sugar transferase [Candidatus Acidoferrales bacterium]
MERKRTERSRNPFLLLLMDARKLLQKDHMDGVLPAIVAALIAATRETDAKGWYEENSVLGAIFTELGETSKSTALESIRAKVTTALRDRLEAEQVEQILVSFHFFPEDWDQQKSEGVVDARLYPDMRQRDDSERLPRLMKRMMDLAGSILALILLSPVFLAVSLAIKLTSKGPVLFRQERVGRYGNTFTLLKFRTMEVSGDPRIHRDYVKRFISGQVDGEMAERRQDVVYKLTEDARVTPVGRFLRKTSVDEFPQFINVLKGEMSLVGPRPPIPYELEEYDLWHRRRILEANPGITGLWQVYGRSKTSFDDMVRLDLRYARTWSLWLDLKILLQTPWAVVSQDGAY